MNTKKCRNCKKDYSIDDVKKYISREFLAESAFRRSTFCSPACAYYFRRKPAEKYTKFMENPYPDDIHVHWHHLNDIIVFPLPDITHKFFGGSQERHRTSCNKKISELFMIDVDNIWRDDEAL